MMDNEPKRRRQLSKDAKRILAEQSTIVAFADQARRLKEAQDKTTRLRALRLAQSK
jgi:hypothetical protein